MIDNNINYVDYLKKHFYIGQIDPWRVHDDGQPILCLLTKVEDALEECKLWSLQDITRTEFIKYLEANRIFVFKNVDEFGKVREDIRNGEKVIKLARKRTRRNLTEEHREKLRKQVSQFKQVEKASIL